MSPSPRLRPSLSITLPHHDYPYSTSPNLAPKTPEPLEDPQSAVQPPPRPQRDTYPTYKVRRKRRSGPADFPEIPEMPDDDFEPIIPTIETSEVASEASSPVLQSAPSAHGLLSPMPSFARLITPPKTPAAQVNPGLTTLDSPVHEWDLINETRGKRPAFERSGSVSSLLSDSSVSSLGSSGFSIPHGGSNGSPVSEATDPFMDDERQDKSAFSPVEETSPSAKRVKRARDVRWTAEMDQHLEATYVRYLQDPRVTPFKTLPGVAPPLGVCSRVASKARRTWPQHRSLTPTPLDTIFESGKSNREGSPDTIRPETSTETATTQTKQPQWPRSDSATRRRLRHIVKHKPALSAYYHRLLHTRSVSPFTGEPSVRSSEVSQEAPAPFSSSFSSRDLSISLVTSTAPSMQPEGPLAQLATEEVNNTNSNKEEPTLRPSSSSPSSSTRPSRPADWFARIGRSQAHQKSQSLQSQLSLTTSDLAPLAPLQAPLASPFDGVSTRSHLLHSMNTTKSLGRRDFSDLKKSSSGLDSPFEGAPTAPRSLKRRFKSDEQKPLRPALEDVFGPSAGPSLPHYGQFQRHQRQQSQQHHQRQYSHSQPSSMRNRGFSLGAVRATDNLAKLFEPPPPMPTLQQEPLLSQEQQQPLSSNPSSESTTPVPQAFATPQIGLPASSSFPSFPASSSSSSSPDQEMTEAPPSLHQQYQHQHQNPTQLPFDLLHSGTRSAPRRLAEPIPRLGSPFMEFHPSSSSSAQQQEGAAGAGAGQQHFNTFPGRYVATASRPQPFQERLRELAARSRGLGGS